ncbi:MAG: aminotransferase class I/II-fold pyridoxal phosphate-dependent enzyme [Arcobacter sp.]|uniref:aminotransferase class I/II-fold pyridoxal phosphate-dependent enzyme n=1 Tax=Arcobacter sp. TaxID=1872629 RepID=UPI003D0D10FF
MDYNWSAIGRQDYIKNTGNIPSMISGWNGDVSKLFIPIKSIQKATNSSIVENSNYLTIDELIPMKAQMAYLLQQNYGLHISEFDFTVANNATNALFMILVVLMNSSGRNILTSKPYYFTVDYMNTIIENSVNHIDIYSKDSFQLNFNVLEDIIKQKKTNILVFTDPIYSTGKSLSLDDYKHIEEICCFYNVYAVFDCAQSGNRWIDNSYFDNKKIALITNSKNLVMFDSLSKQLFINGIKFSNIYANSSIIGKIQEIFEAVSGSFCVTQIRLINELYSLDGKQEIDICTKHNITHFINTYSSLDRILKNSNYSIFKPDSGNFAMIFHKELHLNEHSEKLFYSYFLNKYNLAVFPTKYFDFSDDEHFGFRVNLALSENELISGVSKVLVTDLDLFE